ncbi:hypothetical protein [Pseudoclavibacter sp. JSM 162008]|uniref:hypothetical protein n=1 Tax=Pseudoclavibacter sp. JSM 162008 TaxID=3229855 RepID=UPI0035241FF5
MSEKRDVQREGVSGLDVREVARRRNAALGATLVSTLAGSADARASYQWARKTSPRPGAEVGERLVFAYEQWQKIADAEGELVARLWSIGANPRLGDDIPIVAIQADRFEDVRQAAQAPIDDSFSG